MIYKRRQKRICEFFVKEGRKNTDDTDWRDLHSSILFREEDDKGEAGVFQQ
jgi:hypothetical protein